MINIHKKVELIANLAIIVVAILLCAVLINILRPSTPAKSVAAEGPRITPGIKLSLPGLDWNKGDQTLLMVLSVNCHYCTESTPFYQRLVQQKAEREDIRLVAILPQSTGEAQKYLNDHGVSVDEVRQAVPGAAYANATPTLILVDRTGLVVESWVGKLSTQKEAEVLDRFLSQRTSS
jgi:hypothetical protein